MAFSMGFSCHFSSLAYHLTFFCRFGVTCLFTASYIANGGIGISLVCLVVGCIWCDGTSCLVAIVVDSYAPTTVVALKYCLSACLPWFLASGIAQQGINAKKARVGWWFAQSVILIGGFLLTLNFLPQLGFMFLLLPLFPLLIAVLSFVVALVDEAWSSALASALFFGWILVADFSLAS